jgi:hypothetical protein
LGVDTNVSLRSTAQLMQAADQLKGRANNYYNRLRTMEGMLTRLDEEETAGEGHDEKDSDGSNGSNGSDKSE